MIGMKWNQKCPWSTGGAPPPVEILTTIITHYYRCNICNALAKGFGVAGEIDLDYTINNINKHKHREPLFCSRKSFLHGVADVS